MSWRRFGGNVKVRGDMWSGGKVYAGSTQDVQWERDAANRWYTPDALAVGGSVDFRGTSVKMPYGTASPVPTINGEVNIFHKANVAYLTFRSGGTAYSLGLPAATHGTTTITVGDPP